MLELVVKHGIQSTPMSMVVKESKVAAGTIYHYFPSKDAIINELYLNLKIDFGRVLAIGIDEHTDYKKQFFQIWQNLYEYYCENEKVFLFAQQVNHCTAITPETRQKGEMYYIPIIHFFSKGIEQKVLREMDIKLMTNLIYGNVVSAVQLTLSGDLIMTEERLHMVIQSSWDSIKLN